MTAQSICFDVCGIAGDLGLIGNVHDYFISFFFFDKIIFRQSSIVKSECYLICFISNNVSPFC